MSKLEENHAINFNGSPKSSLVKLRPIRSNKKSSPARHSPIMKPIDQYLNDLNEIYIDVRSESSIISDIDRITQGFNSRIQRHYHYLVKLLPILIIFLPSLLKIFFPKIIKFGKIEIGDNKNNPSNILIDFFSILLICWIIKFLLDWPWKWYSQINEIKQKLYTLLESTEESDKDFQKITNQNLTVLRIQQFCALIMCVGSPFLSGVLLLFARGYIVVIGNDEENDRSLIFSDLNIGIFVSCGIIRVVIQISEHIQQSTASIEIKTEKFISQHNHRNSLDIELRDRHQDAMILDRITLLEQQVKKLTKKFDAFYHTNKLTIESNMTFLSSKHFKILEKEINELHFSLQNKTTDLEAQLQSINLHDSQENQKQQQQSSLHGIPLSPKTPSYISPKSNTSFFPIDKYSKVARQLPSPLARLTQIFPMLDDSSEKAQETNEIAIKELSNLDAIHKYDLASRPIVEYLLNFPFFFRRIVWKIISYIPLSVLRLIYFVLLSILDVLLSKAHKDDVVMNSKTKELDNLTDGSFDEVVAR